MQTNFIYTCCKQYVATQQDCVYIHIFIYTVYIYCQLHEYPEQAEKLLQLYHCVAAFQGQTISGYVSVKSVFQCTHSSVCEQHTNTHITNLASLPGNRSRFWREFTGNIEISCPRIPSDPLSSGCC